MKFKEFDISIVLPVVDMDRARDFYGNKLNLAPAKAPDIPGYAGFQSGDSHILLYKRDEPTKAEHTVATWMVDDVEESVEKLMENGVKMETFDTPNLKTDNRGIAMVGEYKTAWFRDSENNILSITEGEM